MPENFLTFVFFLQTIGRKSMLIQKSKNIAEKTSFVLLSETREVIEEFPENSRNYINSRFDEGAEMVWINRYDYHIFVVVEKNKAKKGHLRKDNLRKIGSRISDIVEENRISTLTVSDVDCGKELTMALVEGIALAGYKFLRYKNLSERKIFPLVQLNVLSDAVVEQDIKYTASVIEGVFSARNLINDPPMVLTAPALGEVIDSLNRVNGLKTSVLNKKMIEKERMNGLLSVGRGSEEPPIFGIIEHSPENAVNTRPIVLVGKGVVFDSGGLALKSAEKMENMKADMSGAATVIGAMQAISAAKLPVKVIALIPAVDNRPGKEAYCPGDIIKMMNGITVEVINPDAEGRMIMADALCYAAKYAPQMIFTVATLTYSAKAAFGSHAAACLTNIHDTFLKKLMDAGRDTHERLALLPNFEEYELMIHSDIADIKNVGGKEAGMITAGAFLRKFTEFPLVHIDIAGTAFSEKKHDYIPKGGTGFGVRLLAKFLQSLAYESV